MSLVSLLYGMELASRQDVSLGLAGGIILAGIGSGLIAIRHLRRAPQPLLDLAVFRVPTYRTAVWWGGFARTGIEAVPYLAPLLFQVGFGLSAFHAGLLLLVTAIGNLGMKAVTTSILRRFGFRTVAIANGTAVAVTILAFAWLAPSTSRPVLYLVLFGYGVTRSLQLSTLTTLSFADVGDDLKSSASTLWSTMQQMTTGLGIAFGAMCLRWASLVRGDDQVTGSRAFEMVDFRCAFVMTTVLTLLPTIAYWRLRRDAGIRMTRR